MCEREREGVRRINVKTEMQNRDTQRKERESERGTLRRKKKETKQKCKIEIHTKRVSE